MHVCMYLFIFLSMDELPGVEAGRIDRLSPTLTSRPDLLRPPENLAHRRESRPYSGLVFQVQVLKTYEVVFLLGSLKVSWV